ncbi:hypothetical protein [Pedobacter gandavensis]|uniref:hypothetical protein n=1 Tax=Pedobacter gandavensis TaxID=2679963 RepID=UPI00292DFAF0|nr:hypothetical protein [Pedobacter gandavensis]
MENKLHYTHLSDNERENPIAFIVDFCTYECDLNEFRQQILDLIKSACSNQKCGNSDNYFFNYRQLLKFLEISHILLSQDETFSMYQSESLRNLDQIAFKKSFNNIRSSCLRLLSTKELSNTNVFFEDFFNHKNLNEWRLTFSQLVEYAYRETTIDEVMEEGSEMVIIQEYTEKLIETVYLIYYVNQTIDVIDSIKAVDTFETSINHLKY